MDKIDFLEKLIKECGEMMKAATGVETAEDTVKTKTSAADLVTVFDEAVQKKLIEGIKTIYPDARFFAEEKENSAQDIKADVCVIIDPIDGTANFVHEMGASVISVAVLSQGVPVLGIIYDPYRNSFFFAEKEKGAFLNGRRIKVSEREMKFSLVAFGSSPYHKETQAQKVFEIAQKIFMRCADFRRSGSAALDMAYVAAGKLDGFFEPVLCPWDFAAGYVLITEAGGKITGFDGKDVDFTVACPVLASNGKIHDELSECILS